MKYYSALKNEEGNPFPYGETWMNLKDITPSEIKKLKRTHTL